VAEPRLRFGRFSFVPSTGELLRDNVRVKLQAQPAKVLAALARQPGEVVSRDLLKDEIWGRDTHVDFERGLNFCIAQIRSALGDSAEAPAYIETIPKQGYRFIAALERTPDAESTAVDARPEGRAYDKAQTRHAWSNRGTAALLAVSLIVVALIGWAKASSAPPTVIVVPFYNETGLAERATLADAIGDATVARLAAPERIDVLKVIGNAGALQNPFARRDVQQAARELDAQWVLIGQLKSDGQKQRVIAHLIRASDMKHLWAQTFDDDTFDLDGQSRAAEAIAAAVTRSLVPPRK
jgi:DNA-binding winged helix-turn-helix (wHTH) protein/TolB-like protein